MIGADTWYLFGNMNLYFDGWNKPGSFCLTDAELTRLTELLSAIEEGSITSIDPLEPLPLQTELYISISQGKRQMEKNYELKLLLQGDTVYLTIFTSNGSNRYLEPRSFRIENEALKDFLESLCDNSRKDISVISTILNHPIVVAHEDTVISIDPLVNWEYETVEYTDEKTPFGIRGRPVNQEEGWIFFACFPGGFTPTEPVTDEGFSSGRYDDGTEWTVDYVRYYPENAPTYSDYEFPIWSSIHFAEQAHSYAVLNQGADSWFGLHSGEISSHWTPPFFPQSQP